MKTTLLAVFAALAVAGCGAGDVPSETQAGAQVDPSADAWAEQAFGMYGEAAVEACLVGFHAELQATAHGGSNNYQAELAQYMCACARGHSELPCPHP